MDPSGGLGQNVGPGRAPSGGLTKIRGPVGTKKMAHVKPRIFALQKMAHVRTSIFPQSTECGCEAQLCFLT